MGSNRMYDPFSIEPIGDMLQGVLRTLRGAAEGGGGIKVDVSETERDYTVTAEIPGARKEDIEVSVERGTVVISARVERSSEEKEGERVIRRERYRGTMRRAFALDTDVDADKVDAVYENGVLRLVLPKKEATPQQNIKVR
ncbi:Hsp20/alpha crystallin family protein [Cupriavidus necator]|uniref:Hsp20/alpha crystallin family protein n=1 Tax=Cupriavidus necator TaxID=106590 RepID=UPI0039C3E20A